GRSLELGTLRNEVFDTVSAPNHYAYWDLQCRTVQWIFCSAWCAKIQRPLDAAVDNYNLLELFQYARFVVLGQRFLGSKQRCVATVIQHPETPCAAVWQNLGARQPLVVFAVHFKLDLVSLKHPDLLERISFAGNNREDEPPTLRHIKPQQRSAVTNRRLTLTHNLSVDQQLITFNSQRHCIK